MLTATAIRQAGLNSFLEDLANFRESQPDSVLSEKNELEARPAAFAVTAIRIIVVAALWLKLYGTRFRIGEVV